MILPPRVFCVFDFRLFDQIRQGSIQYRCRRAYFFYRRAQLYTTKQQFTATAVGRDIAVILGNALRFVGVDGSNGGNEREVQSPNHRQRTGYSEVWPGSTGSSPATTTQIGAFCLGVIMIDAFFSATR
jgi:hypothetical protein